MPRKQYTKKKHQMHKSSSTAFAPIFENVPLYSPVGESRICVHATPWKAINVMFKVFDKLIQSSTTVVGCSGSCFDLTVRGGAVVHLLYPNYPLSDIDFFVHIDLPSPGDFLFRFKQLLLCYDYTRIAFNECSFKMDVIRNTSVTTYPDDDVAFAHIKYNISLDGHTFKIDLTMMDKKNELPPDIPIKFTLKIARVHHKYPVFYATDVALLGLLNLWRKEPQPVPKYFEEVLCAGFLTTLHYKQKRKILLALHRFLKQLDNFPTKGYTRSHDNCSLMHDQAVELDHAFTQWTFTAPCCNKTMCLACMLSVYNKETSQHHPVCPQCGKHLKQHENAVFSQLDIFSMMHMDCAQTGLQPYPCIIKRPFCANSLNSNLDKLLTICGEPQAPIHFSSTIESTMSHVLYRDVILPFDTMNAQVFPTTLDKNIFVSISSKDYFDTQCIVMLLFSAINHTANFQVKFHLYGQYIMELLLNRSQSCSVSPSSLYIIVRVLGTTSKVCEKITDRIKSSVEHTSKFKCIYDYLGFSLATATVNDEHIVQFEFASSRGPIFTTCCIVPDNKNLGPKIEDEIRLTHAAFIGSSLAQAAMSYKYSRTDAAVAMYFPVCTGINIASNGAYNLLCHLKKMPILRYSSFFANAFNFACLSPTSETKHRLCIAIALLEQDLKDCSYNNVSIVSPSRWCFLCVGGIPENGEEQPDPHDSFIEHKKIILRFGCSCSPPNNESFLCAHCLLKCVAHNTSLPEKSLLCPKCKTALKLPPIPAISLNPFFDVCNALPNCTIKKLSFQSHQQNADDMENSIQKLTESVAKLPLHTVAQVVPPETPPLPDPFDPTNVSDIDDNVDDDMVEGSANSSDRD